MAKGEVWPLTVLLLAMHTCAGGAVGGTMYVSPSPMSLSAAIAEVCWRDESSAGYIAGKTFEIIFGPAVLKGEVDAGIPYLEDVRVVRSHAQVMSKQPPSSLSIPDRSPLGEREEGAGEVEGAGGF